MKKLIATAIISTFLAANAAFGESKGKSGDEKEVGLTLLNDLQSQDNFGLFGNNLNAFIKLSNAGITLQFLNKREGGEFFGPLVGGAFNVDLERLGIFAFKKFAFDEGFEIRFLLKLSEEISGAIDLGFKDFDSGFQYNQLGMLYNHEHFGVGGSILMHDKSSNINIDLNAIAWAFPLQATFLAASKKDDKVNASIAIPVESILSFDKNFAAKYSFSTSITTFKHEHRLVLGLRPSLKEMSIERLLELEKENSIFGRSSSIMNNLSIEKPEAPTPWQFEWLGFESELKVGQETKYSISPFYHVTGNFYMGPILAGGDNSETSLGVQVGGRVENYQFHLEAASPLSQLKLGEFNASLKAEF